MYLHIGNNVIIKNTDIIGIFDLEALNHSFDLNNYNIINVSENIEKSLVLTNNNKAYISNISSVTLGKRVENRIFE